ncbi:hypothetical protein B0I32_106286 [Nonomuraea fuscirosea]|uniref:Uncharacterized protein n=2 Tax=Nonomuraea fuscirosea TaxID=1291556 RepID=A0A2T0N2D7_9ACTN|nr:hypothetical protein B0I32_106286 [Nonomuraea fuscirosea]
MDEQNPPSNRKKKRARRIDGKRVVRQKKKPTQLPRHYVECGDKATVVEGHGVTAADLASARAMVLGLAIASTGGM